VSGPAGILLAAGAATRFGSNKLLVPVIDGAPMALHAWRALHAAVADVLVVLSADSAQLNDIFGQAGARVVVCPDATRGMGASLACGVAALSGADGWIVALADMPYVRAETIAAVAAALRRGAAIAAPRLDGRRGHPVGFGREFRDALLALDGDSGGRDILAANATRVSWIDSDDPGCVRDVDTPADLMAAR
jgi:molybdenum cofactor cytidylyltransferase